MKPLRGSLPALVVSFVVAVGISVTIGVSPTGAVCARLSGDDPIPSDAPIVVVGVVDQTAAHAQNALLHVEEIWRGGPLPEWLSLTGTDDANVLWEDATQFRAGQRYLVVADNYRGVIRPRGCGYTTPYTAELAGHRPSSPSTPTSVARPLVWEPGTIPWLWVGLAGLVAAVAGRVLWARRRRSAVQH